MNIINKQCYIDSYNNTKCCARLSSKPNQQCSYKIKHNGLCTLHSKKTNVITVFEPLPSKRTRISSHHPVNNMSHIIRLQKVYRKYLIRNNIYYKGASCYCRHLTSNRTDCAAFIELSDIPLNEYFSYTDMNRNVWGFHIATFKELITNQSTNPYNTQDIPEYAIHMFNKLISRFDKKSIQIKQDIITCPNILLQQRCIYIFQIIDSLNQYTQCKWFLELNLKQLKELYKQVEDIWNYRLQLTNEDKLNYVHDGKLFVHNIHTINAYTSRIKLANIILDNFQKLVTEGKTTQDRTTGALWILSGLTIVSLGARNAFPWLFQSANIY